MTSIRELANHLGVSTATISRALNDKPGVSSEMRQKVLAVAKELHYRPNQAARNLITSRTRNVLFVVHRRQSSIADDPFYPFIMQGMEEILTGEDHSVSLITINDEQLAEGPKAFKPLLEHRADAVIFAGPDILPKFILETSLLGIQTLLVDNALKETLFSAVTADNQGGCNAVTNHLIEVHGHMRVAMLRGPQGWISSEERTRGYLKAMQAAGLEPFVVPVEDTTVETGQEAAKLVLKEKPNTSAIVAANDAMAIGATRAGRELGYAVPDDIAIVGFDNISWASYADPPLTTVRIPKMDMGRIAARSLLDQLNGSVASPSRIIVATELIIRESCGCEPE